jgi:hypothetical protein
MNWLITLSNNRVGRARRKVGHPRTRAASSPMSVMVAAVELTLQPQPGVAMATDVPPRAATASETPATRRHRLTVCCAGGSGRSCMILPMCPGWPFLLLLLLLPKLPRPAPQEQLGRAARLSSQKRKKAKRSKENKWRREEAEAGKAATTAAEDMDAQLVSSDSDAGQPPIQNPPNSSALGGQTICAVGEAAAARQDNRQRKPSNAQEAKQWDSRPPTSRPGRNDQHPS